MRALTLLLLTTCLALVAAAPASAARYPVAIGLGDQNAESLDAPAFKALKLKKTRYFIRWNTASNHGELAAADRFVAAARRNGLRVLMHISSDTLVRRKAKLPSVRQYRREVGKLVRRYKKLGVKEWGVWNEANHDSQPTYRSPARAASYFKVMRSLCRGCTIVALDVLDQRGVESYIARWYKALGSYARYARVVGIHNYSDVNRKRSRGTASILRTVKRRDRVRTQFWFTETGGLVEFGSSFRCSESRAANRTGYMFTLARRYRRDVKRLYAYNWRGTDCGSRFDAGLVRADGSTRPAYATFKRNLSRFMR